MNEQPEKYWIDKFDEYGFMIDRRVTEAIRNESTMRKGFLGRTGMFYRVKSPDND